MPKTRLLTEFGQGASLRRQDYTQAAKRALQDALWEYIFASSLHGIIVADAYGIHNTWLQRPDHNLPRGRLKFLDYLRSVKRPTKSLPSRSVELFSFSEIANQNRELASRNIAEEIQSNLLNSLSKTILNHNEP